MRQVAVIHWNRIAAGDMPDEQGTYLVAFSDGTVESYPMDSDDIVTGSIRAGAAKGLYWAESIPHPDA
jgi:hypothetical protein